VSTPPTAQTLSDRFAAMIAPRRRTDRVTENDEFMAMMYRFARAMESRVIDDPAMLLQVKKYAERVAEIPNVAIAFNAERYQLDAHAGMSVRECGDVLGISQPAASQRRKTGDAIIARRLADAGAHRFSEARREREMIDEANQEAAGITSLAEYKARHLRVA
jgi:hypothetical protein